MGLRSGEIKFLKEALRLAKKGEGFTNPNPMVGCVLVKNGKIIGRGYHKKYGGAHAEIEAIKNAKEAVRGSVLYVNLEPCSHFGKTPPCVDAIIEAGIKKVVCCTLDPHVKVAGKGIKKLKDAGVEVENGFFEKEAEKLNEAFFTFHKQNRPFIVLKFASSLDGKIATAIGDSKWITNDEARQYARKLRGKYQAILVGANTVTKDNPNLGAGKNQKEPLRIILDDKLKMPLSSKVFRDKNLLILTTSQCNKNKKITLIKKGFDVVQLKGMKISAKSILGVLKARNIVSVFVEGGSEAIGTFVDEKMVDKVYVFQAPIIIGGKNSIGSVGGKGVKYIKDSLRLKNPEIKVFGDNIMISADI